MTTKIADIKRGVKMESKPGASLEPTDMDSHEWRAVCQACGWRRDGLPTFEAAYTKGVTHSRITALQGAAHPVLPVGRITITGALIVWRDR